MNLQSLSGHTIDVDRLPAAPVVLDVGARHFDFAGEILRLRPNAEIIALDPDPAIENPRIKGIRFLHLALVHDERAQSGYASYSTGEGNMLTNAASFHAAEMLTVDCVNVQALIRVCGVKRFDVVKLDCEGSEFDILNHWPGPIADQISVEFHDWTGPYYERRDEYFAQLWPKLPDYRVVQHELSRQGEGVGHWDTLLALS